MTARMMMCALVCALAYGGEAQRPAAPAPQAVASDVVVGCYYYPGWSKYAAWKALNEYPLRKPLLGYYHEGDPGVADWHIKWAVEHGISYFLYDWYWSKGQRHHEHAIHDGLFHARYRNQIRYALLWANHNPPGSTSVEDLQAVADFWIANYFKDPQYQTVNGKPIVVIFSPQRIRDDLKATGGARAGLDGIRQRVKAAGLPGIFLVANAYPQHDIKSLLDEGYDAASGYNYPRAGISDPKATRAPYDDMVAAFPKIWNDIRGQGIDYIPVAEAGWDARPWHGPDSLARTDKHPAKFRTMLEQARAFIDQNTPKDRPKMVLLEAWNEFGEGDYIEPHREFGFGYLDAVREVFCPKSGAHLDVVPGGAGLFPDDLHAANKTEWTFKTAADLDSWSAQNLAEFAMRDGVLILRSSNYDPAIITGDIDCDAAAFSALTIRMCMDKGTSGQIFWAAPGAKVREDASVHFPLQPDNQMHDYRVDLSASKAWTGKIAQLRIDITDQADASVKIDEIRLEKKP